MNLYSVFPLSPDNAWAVGAGGTILHWNGTGCKCWSLITSPTTLDLHSVFFPDVSNPNDGWIVGQSDGSFPAMLHWDGVAWVQLDTSHGIPWAAGQVGDLWSVYFLSPSDGWAVGAPGTVTNIVHWGGSWKTGGSWTTKASPDVASTFYSVQVLSNTATPVGGYAVGGVPGTGAILFWDGANWNVYLGAIPGAILRSVWMISSTDAWAVGDMIGANPTAIRVTGTTWGGPMSISALGVSGLRSVVATDSNDAWAVGVFGSSTNIIKWAAPTWVTVSSPILANLYSISKDRAGSDFWAVGAGGTIMRSMDGNTWTAWSSPVGPGPVFPVTPNLYSIFMRTSGDAWAVGQFGAIIHWDGNSWSSYESSPTTNDLYSVYTTSATSGLAVGEAGTILNLSPGPSWSVVASGVTVLLRGVFVLPSGEAWAVGNAPNAGAPATILHWAPPGPWSVEASNTPNGANLTAVYMLSDGSEGWAVGGVGPYPGTAVIDHYYSSCGGGGPCWTTAFGPHIPANVATLNSVFIANDNKNDVWAVGKVDPTGFASAIHYDGTMWSRVTIENAVTGAFNLNTVCMVPGSATDGWTLGDNATASVIGFHWDGVSWTGVTVHNVPTLLFPIYSASFIASDDGWAAGWNGTLIHWGHSIDIETTSATSSTTSSSTATSTGSTTTSSSTSTSTGSSTSSSTTSSSSSSSTTTASTTTTTTFVPSPVPGFPVEAIIIGLLLGAAVPILRRHSRLRGR
jgi:hypothetical protein